MRARIYQRARILPRFVCSNVASALQHPIKAHRDSRQRFNMLLRKTRFALDDVLGPLSLSVFKSCGESILN